MTGRSYSQKVARIFEIVDYLMLVPAGIGALFGLVMIANRPFYAMLLYGFLIVGIILLVGYFKHSRGKLDERYFSALWVTSAIYNFLLLLPSLYFAATLLEEKSFRDLKGRLDAGKIIIFLILGSIVFSYLAAVTSSLKAYSFERRKNVSKSRLSIINP
jgi:hypothetical protein